MKKPEGLPLKGKTERVVFYSSSEVEKFPL